MSENSFLINQNQTFFDLYKPSDVRPALIHGLEIAYKNIRNIYKIKETDRNFDNTVLAVLRADEIIEYIASIVYHLHSIDEDKWYDSYTYVQDELLRFYNKISFDPKIYKALITVAKNKNIKLSSEQTVILNKMIRDYESSGIHLSLDLQKQLKKLNIQEAKLITKFDKNIIDYKKKHLFYVKSSTDLEGINVHTLEEWHHQALEAKYKEGFLIRLSDDNVIKILSSAKNENLRKRLDKASKSVARKSNLALTLKILNIRWQKASLLSKNSPSEYLMQERMIKDPKQALDFINTLWPYYKKKAIKEYKQILDFKNNTLKQKKDYLLEYDYEYRFSLYWKDKLYQHLYGVDLTNIKEYCQLESVLSVMLKCIEEMYGIKFKASAVKSWNENNKVYEVIDKDKIISIIHLDLFSRPEKQNGAWMNALITKDKDNEYPSSIVVAMNLSKPSQKQPTLMNLNDIYTLWHEFGHCMHGVFSNTIYKENGAEASAWDFIEMPSQLMENWCLEPSIVSKYGKHYKTKEPLSLEYIQKIIKSRNYMNGVEDLKQFYLASLDLLLHSTVKFNSVQELDDFQKSLKKEFSVGPIGDYFSTLNLFSHIHHGYKSGYYTYKWSQSLQADIFSIFQTKGLLDPKTSRRYREDILAKGASEDPNSLIEDFLGRKLDLKAILKLDEVL